MTLRVVDPAMRAYYHRRAAEYDQWWTGTGLYSERERRGWHEEVSQLVAVVTALAPAVVLDAACGTGFLTRHLRGRVTCLDQSPAMLELAGARVPAATTVLGDAVPLPFADGSFQRVFTGHFYGHLLEAERAPFLTEAARVAPELVVVDSALHAGVDPEQWQERVLSDGSRHRVYKRFFTGPQLADELGGGEVLHEGTWFVAVRHGTGAAAGNAAPAA